MAGAEFGFRRLFVAISLSASLAAAAQQPARPHLLWIVADDLGWNDVGFMNGDEIHTPAIDSLAREGQVLTNYYVQPSCSPTRATFLTGRYPLQHGINSYIPKNANYGLPLNETSVADLLLRAGYRTRAIGKWHLGAPTYYHTPTFRGFESFFGFYGGGQDYFKHINEGVFDFRRDEGLRCGRDCSRYATDTYGKYSTNLFAKEGVRLIKEHDAATPLFMYFAPQAVHGPQQVPEKFVTPYASTIPERSRRVFAGMVSALDKAIAELLEALEDRAMLSETFVIFTTDNGGPSETCGVTATSNFPLRGSKCSVWDGGTRGIAAVKGPGLSGGAGQAWSGLMHAADWLPTIMSMTGSELPARPGFPLDGIDMWPAWSNGETSPRKDLYYGVSDFSIGLHGPAYRVDDMKIIVDRAGGGRGAALETPTQLWAWQTQQAQFASTGTELRTVSRQAPVNEHFPVLLRDGNHALYNLSSDPDETEDLAAMHPSMILEMIERIQQLTEGHACMDCVDDRCPDAASMQVDVQLPSKTVKGAEPFCDKVYDDEHAARVMEAQQSEAQATEAQAMEAPQQLTQTLTTTGAPPKLQRSGSVAQATRRSKRIGEKWEAIREREAANEDGVSNDDDVADEVSGEAATGNLGGNDVLEQAESSSERDREAVEESSSTLHSRIASNASSSATSKHARFRKSHNQLGKSHGHGKSRETGKSSKHSKNGANGTRADGRTQTDGDVRDKPDVRDANSHSPSEPRQSKSRSPRQRAGQRLRRVGRWLPR